MLEEEERERRPFSLIADCILLLMLELVQREECQHLIRLIPSQYLSTCHGRINSQLLEFSCIESLLR